MELIQKNFIKNPDITNRVNLSSPPTRFGEKYRDALNKSLNIRVFENMNITEISENDSRSHVTNITVKSFLGNKGIVGAKLFVLALGGIENARILLNSNKKHQAGLGNEFDVVGRYFMDHPLFEGIVLYPYQKNKLYPYGGLSLNGQNFSHSIELSREALEKNKIFNARASLTEASNYYLSEGISTYQYLKWAYENDIDIKNLTKHLASMFSDWEMILEAMLRKTTNGSVFQHADEFGGFLLDCMFEFPPEKNNRITLNQDVDALGLRRVNINFRYPKDYMEKNILTLRHISLAIASSGVGRVRNVFEMEDWKRVLGELTGYGDHHMGTTRMGNDRRKSVVDKNLKIHGKENIFVLGSSVFPTGGHVPPTTTIVALAIRAADHFRGKML